MALSVKRTGADDYGRFTKALIVGEPGSGKTLISSTWKNPIYASAEGGLMSVADRNVPYVEIKSSKDLLQLKGQLDQAPEVREKVFGFPIDTVIIDTIDEVQKILIKERLEETRQDSMKMQDWGWLAEQMKAIVTGFRNMPLHVVFTCHIKDKDDQETGQSWTTPGLQGAIGNDIAAYVDFSLLLKTSTLTDVVDGKAQKRIIRVLQTYRDARNPWIKDRSGKLPSELVVNFEDDFQRIYDLVYGNLSLPETQTTEIETKERSLADFDGEKTPEPPKPEPVKKATKAATPRLATKVAVDDPKPLDEPTEASEAKPEPVQTPESDAPQEQEKSSPEAVTEKPSSEAVVPRNKLPEGVVPQSKGYGTNFYCEQCGGEVETDDRAQLSRIRFRKVLDTPCFTEMKR
jgi:hypothetical protein